MNALKTTIAKMYCPKCRENFVEGSRRFCPTDGARLVSEAAEAGRRSGGIFSNLIAKSNPRNDSDETFVDVPHFIFTEPDVLTLAPEDDRPAGDYFEFEDIEPDDILIPVEKTFQSEEQTEPKTAVRKINPYEIPAGHVELEQGARQGESPDFNINDPESFIGQTVKGRYHVTELLGGEGNSFAYLAYDKIFRDKTVLVRIVADDATDEMTASILNDELVALSHLSHPNVARLIDSGQFADKTRFLISEYFEALSINDVLSIHGALGRLRAARIIRQAAYALNEVHQEGIVHRDLRPENIIITRGEDENEQAVLVNFGASNGEANERNLGYKAPEVFDGRPSTISGDIYSLAVVAFEALTGVLPFEGTTANAMVRSQYAGAQRYPSQIRREIRPPVDRVLEKALAFNVADRYVKARDFGDAFFNALSEAPAEKKTTPVVKVQTSEIVVLPATEPAWKNRSAEPPRVENARSNLIAAAGFAVLLTLVLFGWFYLARQTAETPHSATFNANAVQPGNEIPASNAAANTEMPPLARGIPQPPNTTFYQNSKQNLKGDLIRNFVGFTMYYPRDWKVNGPQESTAVNGRGKFLDISRLTPEGRPKEQMLVSYYPSKGTFREDADKFPQMVKEANETLKKLLPGYKMVSEGEIKVNGDWRAYEIKFEGSGKTDSGENLVVWGRRLFIPAARPGVRSGFEITMLATSAADEVKNVNDVGVKGELAPILYSFEPSQNF